MKIVNFFRLNDLKIRSFLVLVFFLQALMIGTIVMDYIGMQILPVRYLVGFVYLAFLPGFILLRIMKIHQTDTLETLCYSVGLSISFLMVTGLLMNVIGSIIRITPFTTINIITTLTVLIIILSSIAYFRDRDYSHQTYIELERIFSLPAMFLYLLPFLAIIGTYIVNFHGNNIILMSLMVIISVVVLLIAFGKFIPSELYPLAVFTIAIALLFHKSLISLYLTGYDINIESYFLQLTLINQFWDWNIANTYNSTLSNTIFPIFYLKLLNINFIWLLKIIYPLLFSVVPLALYKTYEIISERQLAFLSIFLFMSFSAFYGVMLSLAKQQIAEIFLALVILLVVEKHLTILNKKILIILFAISIIFSHYGLAYLFLIMLLISLLFVVFNNIKKKDFPRLNLLTETFILLFIVTIFAWYIYTSSAFTFEKILNIGNQITGNLGELFNPLNRNPDILKIFGQKETLSPLHDYARYIYQIVYFLIIMGIIKLFLAKNREFQVLRKIKEYLGSKSRINKFNFVNNENAYNITIDYRYISKEFILFVISGMFLLFFTIAIPFFSSQMGTNRIFHILLMLLSPFGVLGGIWTISLLNNIIRKIMKMDIHLTRSHMLILVAVLLLIPYFLFNSGFIYEVSQDSAPTSISLSKDSMSASTRLDIIANYYHEYPMEEDVYSAKWIGANRNETLEIYNDEKSARYILPAYGPILSTSSSYFSNFTINNPQVYKRGYIYLNSYNVVKNTINVRSWEKDKIALTRKYNTSTISEILRNKIYSNGDSEIYFLG